MEQLTKIIGQDISAKVAASALLAQAGLTQMEQAKAFGVSREAICQRLQKLPASMNLTSRKLVKESVYLVKSAINGKVVGDIERVTMSNALTAAALVLDRHQPIKISESTQGPSYTQINVNVYQT